MNHYYAHCLDYDKSKCPQTCFRGQLVETIVADGMVGVPLTFMNFKGSSECYISGDRVKKALEDCPFCGGTAEFHESKGGKFRRGWVGCPSCKIMKQWTYTPLDAVEIWNNRVGGKK